MGYNCKSKWKFKFFVTPLLSLNGTKSCIRQGPSICSNMIDYNYYSIISFAGLLCPMGNPWFQEGSQSLFQLSSTGAYTVLWNLDIRSCSAKQWINFKLELQNQCFIQTYMGNLWHLFNRCHCYICCWVWVWEITWFFVPNVCITWLGYRSCFNIRGTYDCHSSDSYWVFASGWQVLQILYVLANQVLSSRWKNWAWCWQHGLTVLKLCHVAISWNVKWNKADWSSL